MFEEEKKDKLVQLFKAATRSQGTRTRTRKAPAGNVLNINIGAGNGDGNGIGNTIIKTERVVTRTIARPQPGEIHITESQVAALHALKDEVLRLEALAKQRPATHQAVWAALNKAMGVGSMRMIEAHRFADAEKYLRAWIGRLSSTASVRNKAPDDLRRRRIAYIQTNMKKLDLEHQVRAYMYTHFAVTSLADLPDQAALDRVYRYVAGLKKVRSTA